MDAGNSGSVHSISTTAKSGVPDFPYFDARDCSVKVWSVLRDDNLLSRALWSGRSLSLAPATSWSVLIVIILVIIRIFSLAFISFVLFFRVFIAVICILPRELLFLYKVKC